MIDYDIYKKGYSVLPKLNKLGNEPIFIKNDTFDYKSEKQKAIKNQKCFFEHEMSNEIYDEVCNFIYKQTNNNLNTFEKMCLDLQEDLAIHRVENEKDWLSSCHICFPSGWLPEEKIGKSFKQIHQTIPEFNLKSSYNLAKSMVYSGPFVRYVWSPVYEKKINFHPLLSSKKFDIDDPFVYIKIERQITIGFPKLKCALFVIRQEMQENIDYKSLYKSCCDMSEEQKNYKGISKEFLSWLNSK